MDVRRVSAQGMIASVARLCTRPIFLLGDLIINTCKVHMILDKYSNNDTNVFCEMTLHQMSNRLQCHYWHSWARPYHFLHQHFQDTGCITKALQTSQNRTWFPLYTSTNVCSTYQFSCIQFRKWRKSRQLSNIMSNQRNNALRHIPVRFSYLISSQDAAIL